MAPITKLTLAALALGLLLAACPAAVRAVDGDSSDALGHGHHHDDDDDNNNNNGVVGTLATLNSALYLAAYAVVDIGSRGSSGGSKSLRPYRVELNTNYAATGTGTNKVGTKDWVVNVNGLFQKQLPQDQTIDGVTITLSGAPRNEPLKPTRFTVSAGTPQGPNSRADITNSGNVPRVKTTINPDGVVGNNPCSLQLTTSSGGCSVISGRVETPISFSSPLDAAGLAKVPVFPYALTCAVDSISPCN